MTTVQFLSYYNRSEEIPDDHLEEYTCILGLLKNRYGEFYRDIITKQDYPAIEEIITFQQEFMQEFHSRESFCTMQQSKRRDIAENSRIFIHINSLCRKELILQAVDELVETFALHRHPSSSMITLKLQKLRETFHIKQEEFLELLVEKGVDCTVVAEQGASLPDIIRQGFKELQKSIKDLFYVQLRFCSGKEGFPKRIWSSYQHKKYNLDIIQENTEGNEFTFLLYSNAPLGSGTLVVRTKDRKVKEFRFTHEEKSCLEFIYKGKIRHEQELYFLIKER